MSTIQTKQCEVQNRILRNRTSLGVALAALLAMICALPISATAADADSSQNADSPSTNSDQKPISDSQLKKFAAAYGELLSIRKEYTPKLKNADGKDERKQLKQEGQKKMMSAIRDADMEISEYKRIGQRLQNDKKLQSRFKEMQQQGGNAGAGNSGGAN